MEQRLAVGGFPCLGHRRVQRHQFYAVRFAGEFPSAGPSHSKWSSRRDSAQWLSDPGLLGWRPGSPRHSLKRKIRWGVIGSGGIARRRTIPEGILPAVNAELVSVCSANPESCQEVARQFNAQACANEAELLRTYI